MKIAVYSAKGGAGKTPIATNIVLDREYALGTNEHFHVFDSFIPDDRLLALKANEAFPDIPADIDIVFDLGGSITENSASITSAIKQADLVIVPIEDHVKSLVGGIGTIREIARFNKSILVVATKLDKQRKESFGSDWSKSKAFLNVKDQLEEHLDFHIPILPLKFSKVFEAIFEKELSVQQLVNSDPLAKYNYREVCTQFKAIYKFIDDVAKHKQKGGAINAEQKQSKQA